MQKPEILCHPHIPKPMHGISPREIMGREWWDETRKQIYQSTNYHCIACGIAKEEAKGHQWLESHEFWQIDYTTGICKIKSIEPLCHYCHNFIHSGRLARIIGKEKLESEVIEILEHGFKILAEFKLECFPFTLDFARSLKCKTFAVKAYSLKTKDIKWNDWKLIWNGKEYKSKFKSYKQWKDFYMKGGNDGIKW